MGDLKKAIKKEKKNMLKDIDADKLQLFLAKKDGAWLKDDDPAALELEEGKTHQDIQTVIDGEKVGRDGQMHALWHKCSARSSSMPSMREKSPMALLLPTLEPSLS
ncbi:hypothetical protein PF008_g25892 [Phytophthora fragariae]|uniref:Crinkler effector protein N-terminal domain-containing protein n=1 Tax=Phytophthora fragariae TaxID=53985 RepID=A0A6G0QIL6_9STRA|nr:hypothetical protein PF008_g25892 [Phytophthora fragariae]